MNNGCIDCCNNENYLDDNLKLCFKCVKYNSECKNWWKNNSEKRRGEDSFDSMYCYEESNFAKSLTDTNKKLEKTLKEVKEIKK